MEKPFIPFTPKAKDEAITIAQSYINAGFSVDVGYMQLNSDNFKQLNTTLRKCFRALQKYLIIQALFFITFIKIPVKKIAQ